LTDRRNRELVLAGLRELPTAYEALEYQVARGGSVQVPSRGEPPIPIRTAVMDMMTDFETPILRLHSRALVVLGWHLRPVKFARKGQHIACPACGANSLMIDRQSWFVFCAMPSCDGSWAWDHEIELLGQIVQALALEVADDLGADADGTPSRRRTREGMAG
jgi:hypothetical protein